MKNLIFAILVIGALPAFANNGLITTGAAIQNDQITDPHPNSDRTRGAAVIEGLADEYVYPDRIIVPEPTEEYPPKVED